MSITATEIQNIRFSEARRGYDPDEVDEFLERVAADVDALNRAIAEAAARVSEAEGRARLAEEGMSANASVAMQEPTAFAAPRSDSAFSEDVISRAFIAAQVSADNLRDEARREAEKLYREAEAKAKDFISDAHTERSRMLSEIEYLREVSERFRTEFLSLLNHYNADAQKRFSDFAELIPEEAGSGEQQSIEEVIDANNAAVVASSSDQVIAEELQLSEDSSPVSFDAVSDNEPSAGGVAANQGRVVGTVAVYGLDDDLEIEEID